MFRKLFILFSFISVLPFGGTHAEASGDSVPIEKVALLYKEGKLAEAINVLKADQENHSNDFEFYRLMGSVYLAIGNTDAAIDAIKKAETLNPGSSSIWMLLSNAYNQRLNEVGIFRKFGAARDVRDTLEMVIKLDPKHAEALQYLAMFYSSAPKIAGRDVERGAAMLDRLEGVDRARWFHAKARIAQDAGDKKAAVGYYVSALDENPNYEEVYLYSANLLESMVRMDEALGALLKGYDRVAEPRALFYQLARVSSNEMKSCDIGMSAIGKYLDIPPVFRNISEAWIRYRRGLLHQCLGDADAAASDYADALRLDKSLDAAKKAMAKIGR